MTYNYSVFNSCFKNYKIKVIKGRLYYPGCDEEGLYVVASKTGDWGEVKAFVELKPDLWPLPNRMEMRYQTICDGQIYNIDTPLDDKRAEDLWEQQVTEFPLYPFINVLVGTAPHGGIAVWLCSLKKSVLLHWFHAEKAILTDMERSLFASKGPDFTFSLTPEVVEEKMRQYRYRYVALEEYFDRESMWWNQYEDTDPYYDDLELDAIEDKRTDGTFNYLGGQEQEKYHTAGKPERITVKWRAGSTNYLAHFWIDDDVLTGFFKSFYKPDPDGKADLLIRLDPEKNAYGLALKGDMYDYEYFFPHATYQLMVFKDDTEWFRSDNFDKADDAWRW
jgi:hypothetical protein